MGPVLNLSKGTGTSGQSLSALQDGDHFAPGDDADPFTAGLQLKLCGGTTSADAVDLPASVGTNQNNFCVALGGNNPSCAPVTSSNSGSACVNLTCPGGGQFSLAFTLKDSAQNPTSMVKTGLTCAASNPTVAFVNPLADTAPYSDISKRILAANNLTATRRDKDGNTPGAQYDVTACTSAPVGSTAVLRVGRKGETLNQVKSQAVTNDTSNLCKGAYPSVVTFTDVTIPESLTDASFQLSRPSELEVTVTDLNRGSTSEVADIWVDSTSPNLTLNLPAGLCGSYTASATDVTKDLTFGTPIASVANPINLQVTNPDSTQSLYQGTTLTFSQSKITGVVFKVGTSTLTASVTEPSGNSGALAGTCSVEVGSNPPPTVSWSAPVAASLLTAPANGTAGAIADADTGTPGWQGTLRVCTDLAASARAGVFVQFSANGTNVGAPVALDTSTGCATLSSATIPEGAAVSLRATTSGGVNTAGSSTINVPVDVTIPSAPSSLASSIKNRRATTFGLTWTAAADGTGTASDYQVRVSKSIIDDLTKFDVAEDVPYGGTPGAAGATDSIDVGNRRIENDYYFAVRAVDSVGNVSPIVNTTTPARATFLVTNLAPQVQNKRFGGVMTGTADLNGDTFYDLVVAHSAGNEVDIFFGSANGLPTTPSVVIQSSFNQFGTGLANIGDVNKSGRTDLAIGSPSDGDGKVFVFYGRATWPTTLTESAADVTIVPDVTADPKFAGSTLGVYVAGLGDYNRDGVDDFAIGGPGYSSSRGQVTIVYGKSGGLSTVIQLPSAHGTAASQIVGDSAFNGKFGQSMVGLGQFYGASLGSAMVVSAYAYNTNVGRLYTFRGTAGTPASIALSSALQTVDGLTSASHGLGRFDSAGRRRSRRQAGIGISMTNLTAPYRADIRSGVDGEGPLSRLLTLGSSESMTGVGRFARVLVGGGTSGSAATFSFIGSSRSDVVVSVRPATGAPRIYIVDGDKLTFGTTTTVESLARRRLPSCGLGGVFSDGHSPSGRQWRRLRRHCSR
ncbi:MAG: hypothetical protein QM784_15045 [Polyangiaceae bacterium]